MSNDKILVRFDAAEGERLINRLATRREDAFQKLERLRLALADLHGKDPTRPQIEDFLNCENERAAKTLALKIWIAKAGGTALPFDVSRAVDVLEIPASVAEVAAAWRDAHNISKDPWRYWSDTRQGFKSLPVTSGEQARINESCKFYAASTERAEFAKAVSTHLSMVNFANKHTNAGISAAKFEQLYPHMVYFTAIDKKVNYRNDGHHFVVKWSAFLIPGERPGEIFEN